MDTTKCEDCRSEYELTIECKDTEIDCLNAQIESLIAELAEYRAAGKDAWLVVLPYKVGKSFYKLVRRDDRLKLIASKVKGYRIGKNGITVQSFVDNIEYGAMYYNANAEHLLLDDYGKTWIAYARKPKPAEDI